MSSGIGCSQSQEWPLRRSAHLALAEVLIYLALGELPWQGIQAESKEPSFCALSNSRESFSSRNVRICQEEKHEKIMELKQQISVEDL